MITKFPSMPPYDPVTPEGDGFAHVTLTGDGDIVLQLGDRVVQIPGRTISKGSVVIKPGSNDDVNRVQLEFLASDVWMDDGIRGEVKVYP